MTPLDEIARTACDTRAERHEPAAMVLWVWSADLVLMFAAAEDPTEWPAVARALCAELSVPPAGVAVTAEALARFGATEEPSHDAILADALTRKALVVTWWSAGDGDGLVVYPFSVADDGSATFDDAEAFTVAGACLESRLPGGSSDPWQDTVQTVFAATL